MQSHVVTAQRLMLRATSVMSARVVKRLLQYFALFVALAYCSLIYYQTRYVLDQDNGLDKVVSVAPLFQDTNVEDGSAINNSSNFPTTTLDDIFISVKTTRHYQDTRLPLVLKTWFQLAKNQTWFFTDVDNPEHQKKTDGHMVNTNCVATHEMKHLCCKMSVEYDYYMESGKKWFCHFDDDNYVNVPRLLSKLQEFDPNQEWYLGKKSVNAPLHIPTKNKRRVRVIDSRGGGRSRRTGFWFATGGAGFCISRAMALRMMPAASGGRFISVCDYIRLPDDCAVGFIIEHLLNRRLTEVKEFHSHLEPLKLLNPDTFKDQISFSYFQSKEGEWSTVKIDGFDDRYDPQRFLSLHCFLFPHFEFCPRR